MKILVRESTKTINITDNINEYLRSAIKATRVPESSYKFEFDDEWQCDTVSYHTSRSKLLRIRDNIKAAGYTKFDEKLSSTYCTCRYFNDKVFVFIEIDGNAGDVVIVPRCNEASPLAVKHRLFTESSTQDSELFGDTFPPTSDVYKQIKSIYKRGLDACLSVTWDNEEDIRLTTDDYNTWWEDYIIDLIDDYEDLYENEDELLHDINYNVDDMLEEGADCSPYARAEDRR